MTIEKIEMQFHLEGYQRPHRAVIYDDGTWYQDGATTEQLGETVEAVEAMRDALLEQRIISGEEYV
jgi:hypothetical protein